MSSEINANENNAKDNANNANIEEFRINYIKQINAFNWLSRADKLSSDAQALYWKLLMYNNISRWSEWFKVTNETLKDIAGVNTIPRLIKARKSLINKGYIKFVKGTTNHPNSYHIVKLYEPESAEIQIKLKIEENKDKNIWLQIRCDEMKAENNAQLADELSQYGVIYPIENACTLKDSAEITTHMTMENSSQMSNENSTNMGAENQTIMSAENQSNIVPESAHNINNNKNKKSEKEKEYIEEMAEAEEDILMSARPTPSSYTINDRTDIICQWLREYGKSHISSKEMETIKFISEMYDDHMINQAIDAASANDGISAGYLLKVLKTNIRDEINSFRKKKGIKPPAVFLPRDTGNFSDDTEDVSIVKLLSNQEEDYTQEILEKIKAEQKEMEIGADAYYEQE